MSDDSYALPRRPEPDPLVVALVGAALDQLTLSPGPARADASGAHLGWRFSGRWWMKPSPLRRERPWARG